MTTHNDQTIKAPITLQDLEKKEADTARRNLVVRSGLRAGGDGTSFGRYAKYV